MQEIERHPQTRQRVFVLRKAATQHLNLREKDTDWQNSTQLQFARQLHSDGFTNREHVLITYRWSKRGVLEITARIPSPSIGEHACVPVDFIWFIGGVACACPAAREGTQQMLSEADEVTDHWAAGQ